MKKYLALLLALAMLFSVMAGCAKTETTTEPAETQASSETEPAAAAESSQTEEATEPAAAEEEAETVQSEEETAAETVVEEVEEVIGPDYYYVTDGDPIEISLTFSYMYWFSTMFDSWGSSPWWQPVEEATNVKFVFNELMNTTYSEKVSLMIAGGDTTDTITELASVYSGGLKGAIDDEVIYDVAPYIEEYAPLYYERLYAGTEEADNMLDGITNEDGTMGAMYAMLEEPLGITGGSWIRTDWLEGVGMEIPTTIDELYEVLCAFRDKYNADAALYQNIGVNDVGVKVQNVWNAFGELAYFVEDGQVKYGLEQPYAQDYFIYLRKLADAGVFTTSEYTDLTTKELMSQNRTGMFGDNISTIANNLVLMDEGVTVKAIAAFGEPTEYGSFDSLIPGQSAALSLFTTCEYPELVLKMCNWLYTEEGSLHANYGLEGLSFEYDADGNPTFTDLVINNPDGIPVDAALGYWTDRTFLPALLDGFRTYYNYEDYQLEASDIWATAYTGNSKTMPSVTLTTEENDSIRNARSDLNTYLNEQENLLVFGSKDPSDDATWQAFVDGMQSYLPLLLEVNQTAYDRYLKAHE